MCIFNKALFHDRQVPNAGKGTKSRKQDLNRSSGQPWSDQKKLAEQGSSEVLFNSRSDRLVPGKSIWPSLLFQFVFGNPVPD